jgi:kynurenine formamidase
VGARSVAVVTSISRIVDLSVVLDDATQVYPGDPQPRLSPATRIATEGFNLLALEVGSQSGTHVDSPYHFLERGPKLEECDLDLFIGRAVVIDVQGREPRSRIGWDALAYCEGALAATSIAVLHTGWSERFYGTSDYFDHPFLDGDACRRMLELGIRTFAIDAINLDETMLDGREPDFSCHLHIAGAGGIIAENLTNLSAVVFDPVISLLPVRLGGDADGAPCRAVALEIRAAE